MATREHQGHRLPALVIWVLLVASADARIVYVDHSAGGRNNGERWEDAFTNLSVALEKARAGDEIRVARGTYRPALPTGDRAESFDLGKASGATIRGGYAGLTGPEPDARDFEAYPTILSGDLRGDDEPGFQHDGDNCFHVLTGAGTDPTTVLEGFTITGGHASEDEPCGAGLYNDGGALTIRDCHFLGNIGQDNGGAVFNKAGALKLIRCRFSDNRATNGGAIYSVDNSVHDYPVLLACRFNGNRADSCGGGLYHNNSHAELVGCAFYANWAAYGGAVYNNLSDPNLINCLFSGNRAEDGGGVYNDLGRPNLINCTFSRNAADDYGGGLYNFDASPTLTNCILWANSDRGGTDGAAQIHLPADATVRYCCIQGWTDQWGGLGNIDLDPRFADDDGPDDKLGTEDDDLSLRRKSPCLDAGDSNALPSVTFGLDGKREAAQRIPFDFAGNPRVANGRVDLGAFEFCPDLEPGDIIYVDADAPSTSPRDGRNWATAFVSLQQALQVARDYSGPPRQIWVAAGTYTPSAAGTRENASFSLVSNVAVYGGFAGSETALEERDPERYVTILSGDLQHNDVNVADPCDLLSEPTRADNCCHVVTGSETDATAVLDGFTITGGVANGALSDASGGGIYIRSGSPTLRRCTFRDNAATACGGAIYCRSRAPKILACTIRHNSAGKGGGIYCDSSSPTIQDNTIADNYTTGDGAGIACADQSAPVIEHNTISGNRTLVQIDGGGSGAGIGCLASSAPRILRNTILRNAAYDGGGLYCDGAHPTILNNMIIANTAADDGGGICAIEHSQPVIRNNTIVRNRANPQGGGIYCESSQATITNCILWENGDDFHNWSPENDCNATYSCIQDGDPGVGNISIYPHFVDPEHDDYHLKAYSPCIDAGKGGDMTIELLGSGEKDIDGNDRVRWVPVDMGADETDVWKRMQDMDNDGLPDDWELEHLGGLQWDGNDDPDADTYSNRFEYEKGASPGVAQRNVVYVGAHGGDAQADGSPEHPFASIQQGIDVVGEGGEVRVTTGTFHERLVIDGKVVSIRGGYALDFATGGAGDYTVLSADGQGRGVLYVNVPAGLLTGFRITNGWEKDGAGMYLHYSSPTIRHNIIEDNNAVEDGGGVSFFGPSQPLFEDCNIIGNSAGDNAGGLYCRGSSPTFRRCEITGNWAGDGGGAMRVRGAGEPDFTDCTFSGNSAGDEGGAIVCREQRGEESAASLRLTRCSIYDNHAEGRRGRGGLVLRPGTHTTIADSTLYGNTPPGLWADGSTIRIEGIVETFDSNWVITDVNIVRNPSGAGTAELRTGPGTELIVDNCGLQCDLTGPATITVDRESQFRIEGRACVNLATDPVKNGVIQCYGLLFVRDKAQITGADVNVARASFEGDVDISNSVIHAEAGVPYGQFFVADTVRIADSEIHADGDRYMDLDPAVFAGLIEKNRIFVEIREGVGHTRGGLFELRGLDLYGNPNDPLDQFLYPCQVPDFNTVTWTIEELKLAPGAKLNLTNRFDFQKPYTEGGENEVLYVRHLVLGPNSVLNTAFNRVYYETKDVNDSAVIESVPLLGFSLNNIAFDSENEFLARVRHNNVTEPPRRHVQWVVGAEPDPNGMMQMCNLPDTDANSPTFGQVIEARAKGLFAKSNEPWIQIRFEYLFRDPAGSGEVVIYLSDCPELLGHDDPNRSLHYLEVARLPHPPVGRPGSAQGGQWGIFEQMVPVGNLNFVRGTRIELELLGPAGTCVRINNWDPGIRCTSIVCGDVAGNDTLVNALDFLAVLSECGRRVYAGESEESDLYCLDGFFCADGYVTVQDALAVDWTTERKNLCPETSPAAGFDYAAYASPAAPDLSGSAPKSLKPAFTVAAASGPASASGPEIYGRFLVAAKRYLHREGTDRENIDDFLSDRLYGLDSGGNLVDGPFQMAKDRFNGKLIRDPVGGLYQLNLELGLVRLADNAVMVGPGSFDVEQEFRCGPSAVVYVGCTDGAAGLPVLDAAFDEKGFLYVVPVVVDWPGGTDYAATAKLELDTTSPNPGYRIVQVFDDGLPAGDNQDVNQLREVEVDRDGNVYVLNCHYRNQSDILWAYRPDGTCRSRLELGTVGISAPVGLCVSSFNPSQLYVASAENPSEANGVKVYVLSAPDLKFRRWVEVQDMGHITDITEDPADGTICVLGFRIPRVPSQEEIQNRDVILDQPPFYQPCLATIPYGSDGSVKAVCLWDVPVRSDMALPVSVVCARPGANAIAPVASPTGRSP
jgi:predicted outer membrane repeat protein